jgi:hypothetical protein
MSHLGEVLSNMGAFAPISVVILLLLKGAGNSRYSPPPQGGPGGDMGMAKTVRKAFRTVVGLNHDEPRH